MPKLQLDPALLGAQGRNLVQQMATLIHLKPKLGGLLAATATAESRTAGGLGDAIAEVSRCWSRELELMGQELLALGEALVKIGDAFGDVDRQVGDELRAGP